MVSIATLLTIITLICISFAEPPQDNPDHETDTELLNEDIAKGRLITVDQSLDHTTRAFSPELAVNCTKLRIPSSLCSACPLKPFDADGNFEQHLDAFELSGSACQKVLKRYVVLNPCDTVRERQIANQGDRKEARGLELFMYAMCETCCDCIPIGARVEEYEERKANATLLAPLRGNCVMHYWFDTCKILPLVSDNSRRRDNFLNVSTPVCDIIRKWRERGFGREWELDPEVDNLPGRAKRYLARFIRFAGCKKKTIWESCIPMEMARGRI